MKKIKLYIAASIDGYIAEADGSVDFLSGYPVNEEMNYGYNELIASVDTVIMGGRTYHDMQAMDIVWPYKEQTTYVITRQSFQSSENIRFITNNIIETIKGLRKEDGKDIWLVGGGEIISMLLDADLIDEMQLFYIPVILGNGIRLFPKPVKPSQWKLLESKLYVNGVLEVMYQRK